MLDRTKEPGSFGEPLFLDVLAALGEPHARGERERMPRVIGGRYGLSSKEFTPGMVAGVLEELALERPRPRFTIGINDDVSGTSLPYDGSLDIEPPARPRAVFFGLGSDGTVGANKNTIKILGEQEGLHAQGYFVYDSKKSGSQTVSHLRFGPEPIRAPYLVAKASFVGCHQFGLLERDEVLERAAPGATLLLNTHHPADRVWDALSRPVQEQILAKRIDALRDRRGTHRPRGRPAGPDQHGAADVLLRDLGRARAGARDRTDQGPDRQDVRPSAGRRWWSATGAPSTARSRASTASSCRTRSRRPASPRRSSPRARRSSCAP